MITTTAKTPLSQSVQKRCLKEVLRRLNSALLQTPYSGRENLPLMPVNTPRAQQAFSAFLKAWPKDPHSGEARYYLGESLFWQKQYYKSAEVHLDTHNEYPEAPTAADNLLGLGLSLAGLNQREVACATYAEV